MSQLTMTQAERETFLADVHVGMIGVADDGDRAPLTVPVWYAYDPGGDVLVTTGGDSRKARCLQRSGRASLCAQTETAPYQYVSVEGPVTIEPGADPEQRRAIARRYLGNELGDAYVEATAGETAGMVTVRLRPERWLTVDYSKQFG